MWQAFWCYSTQVDREKTARGQNAAWGCWDEGTWLLLGIRVLVFYVFLMLYRRQLVLQGFSDQSKAKVCSMSG